MKTFLKVFFMVIVSLLIIIGGIIGYFAILGGEYDKNSKAFIDNALPEVMATWDYTIMKKYAHPGFLKQVSEKDFVNLKSIIEKNNGKYIEYLSSSGEASIKKSNKRSSITALYKSDIKFTKGVFVVTSNLVYQDEKWSIIKLHFDIARKKEMK